MSEVSHYPGNQETSPRSTILTAKPSSMTSALPLMINESNMASKEGLPSHGRIASNQDIDSKSSGDSLKSNTVSKSTEPADLNDAKSFDNEASPTPVSHDYSSYLQYSNPTPSQQPMSGYYVYPPQTHMIPDPESPGGNRLIGAYDVGSFFQPHSAAAFHPTSASPNAVLRVGRTTMAPHSPSKGLSLSTPTSPLFTRVSNSGVIMRTDGMSAMPQGPPTLPYMASPQLAPNVYQMYPTAGVASNGSDDGTWAGQTSEARNQNSYQQANMHGMHAHYGVPLTRATSSGRSYSVDESMLPPSILEDQVNPAYSPYPGGQVSHASTSGFSPQLSWAYSQDMYGPSTSPLQPRPTVQLGMIPSSPGAGMRPGSAYGQNNYTMNSPGHPIQTSALNKGPDGANLFIFHIPNHYTNLDMYHLFIPYGNLLSVRIMVERDTGRSRGFGFVSYDSAEAAALAIKELNGYPIGNKRLKVQHKQIRRNDFQDDDGLTDGPSQTNWYASGNVDEEGVILNDNDDENTLSAEVKNRPDDAVDQSPLTTLGQLKNTLPDVSGHDVVVPE